jgi:hypothetical protein
MIVPPIGRATGAVVLGAIIKKIPRKKHLKFPLNKIDLLKHRV